jgi:hypothetical protein
MELTELDLAILVTILLKGGKSKTAHFPEEFVCRCFPTHQQGAVKKRLKALRRGGYLSIKPHPSGASYGLSDEGWNVAKGLEADARSCRAEAV